MLASGKRGYEHFAVAECGDSEVAEQYLPIIHLVFANLKTWLTAVSTTALATSTYKPTSTSSPSASTDGSTRSTPSAHCSASRATPLAQPMPSFTRPSGPRTATCSGHGRYPDSSRKEPCLSGLVATPTRASLGASPDDRPSAPWMFSTAADLRHSRIRYREFQRLFHDDAACAAYLEKARWGDGFACPHCEILWRAVPL